MDITRETTLKSSKPGLISVSQDGLVFSAGSPNEPTNVRISGTYRKPGDSQFTDEKIITLLSETSNLPGDEDEEIPPKGDKLEIQENRITAGENHTVVIGEDGSVWGWGSNLYGQIGTGSMLSSSKPTRVEGIANIVSVSAGWNNTIALGKDGGVWGWGSNHKGKLCDGTKIDRYIPGKLSGLDNDGFWDN